MRDIQLRMRGTVARHQVLELGVAGGVSAAMADEEQTGAWRAVVHIGISENRGHRTPQGPAWDERPMKYKRPAPLCPRRVNKALTSVRYPGSWIYAAFSLPRIDEWQNESDSPLTVAGPRRPFTGLPWHALAGI